LRVGEHAEAKSVCVSLLRDKAVLRDIRKAGHRIVTAIRYFDFFSTEFRRFDACCCRCSGDTASDRWVRLSCSQRSVALA